MQILLKHLGGTTQLVDVIDHKKYRLTIKWGMAGTYDLLLKTNKLIRAPMWSANDIKEAWQIFWQLEKERNEKYKITRAK